MGCQGYISNFTDVTLTGYVARSNKYIDLVTFYTLDLLRKSRAEVKIDKNLTDRT